MTVFRFKGAGFLNDRSNIIVLVDEAHRTQEAMLGDNMLEALPNAQFFGLTGTPIADLDRNTFKLFGDPNDPGWARIRPNLKACKSVRNLLRCGGTSGPPER